MISEFCQAIITLQALHRYMTLLSSTHPIVKFTDEIWSQVVKVLEQNIIRFNH